MAGGKNRVIDIKAFFSTLKGLFADFKRERLFSLLLVFFAVVILGGIMVYFIEKLMAAGDFESPLDALWWGIVTLTTVGYGDYYPVSLPARLLAVLMMLSGMVIASILSGTIASIYVERKIREGKGLQDISYKNHVILAGWNRYARGLIESLMSQYPQEDFRLALISEMTPEAFDEIRVGFPDLEVKFVRGDIANESVLKRSNISSARICIIIPDESGGKSFLAADDKTILSALAVKSLNPEIHLTAQIVHDQNATHLQRAQVDEIIFGDEIIRHILSNSTMIHGIPDLLKEMLDPHSPKRLHLASIPADFVGKPFKQYALRMLEEDKGICLGILSEEKSIGLVDILSEDSSGIDAFIKRKFLEAEINLEEEQDVSLSINLNPGAGYTIKSGDSAFVIGGTA
jgi:voltage-gated potassium channel